MGGSSSKPAGPIVPKPVVPTIDYSLAKFDASAVEAIQRKAAESIAAANRAAQEQAAALAQTTGMLSRAWIMTVVYVVITAVVVVGALLGYDLLAQRFGWPTTILPASGGGQAPSASVQTLYINSAKYGVGGTTVDVSTYLASKILNSTTLPGFVVGPATVGLGQDPVPNVPNTLYVTWYVGSGNYQQTTVNEGSQFPTLPTAQTGPAPVSAPAPPAMSSFFSFLTGSTGSGDLLGSGHDGGTAVTVSGTNAPLSDQGDGAYGMQWWMFVKDWNYGFGKKKSLIKRPDTTNPAVMNPHISLHPTDNTLQVSVSVFPSTEGGASKAAPAPAGHADATDDVFVCEVPNIPLQAWFAVSVSVFGRNLDVYIDGKLVKSCLLPGVPKPAVGDIHMTSEGGFSGKMCGFYHYPRMLTPADALNFWSAGTSCQTQTDSPVSKATGYAVKFGVYDSLGKQVQEYSF